MRELPNMRVSAPPLSARFLGDDGRQPQCKPNPNFPDGRAIDASGGSPVSCEIELKHPTPECGIWSIECSVCKLKVIVTAAARPDDPSRVRLPCGVEGRSRQ